MSIWNKLFGKKTQEEHRVGGMEDFMLLIRVYYQALMAQQMGISNLAALPDLRIFKQTYRVTTQNNKLGVGEKARCKKLLKEMYDMSDNFFKEIDNSIKKHCRTQNEIQPYMFLYQGFLNDLMMMMSTLMQWKIRIPSIFKSVIKSEVEKSVHKICTKTVWSKDDEHKTAANIRMYKERLGYSEQWMSEYVYNVLMLAKKAPKPKDTEKK